MNNLWLVVDDAYSKVSVAKHITPNVIAEVNQRLVASRPRWPSLIITIEDALENDQR